MSTRDISERILYCEDGEVVFEENSIGDEMYVIQSGQVEISQRIGGEKTTIAILGRGDFFGEMAVTGAPRYGTAVAMGRTTLMSFSMEEVLERMQTNLQFATTVLQTLVNRLHTTCSRLRGLLARVGELGDGSAEEILLEKRSTRIGEILIEMGFLTKEQLEAFLEKQKEMDTVEHRRKLLGEIILESGIITEQQMHIALAEQRVRLRR